MSTEIISLDGGQLARIAKLAQRGFIEELGATDSDLDLITNFKDSIERIVDNNKLRKSIEAQYISYNELSATLADPNSTGEDRKPWELEIIYKVQILRKLLLEMKQT